MSSATIPFSILAPGVATGEPAPSSWCSLSDLPLVIIVGVTGVGKSTTLNKLAGSGVPHTLLPNRRELTDRLIIPSMQMLDGAPVHPVTDRKQRFEYTRRYRAHFPGGMSHTLAHLRIDPGLAKGVLIFDGLRGAEEAGHALQLLPDARFIVLHAADAVRVRRLLGRNDAFDRIDDGPLTLSPGLPSFSALGVGDAATLFTHEEEQALLALVHQGGVNAGELREKIQIVVEERRNYDPADAIEILQQTAPTRTLIIDTTQHSPTMVFDRLISAFEEWRI